MNRDAIQPGVMSRDAIYSGVVVGIHSILE